MATITGARGTGNISSDQRYIDMAPTISLLEPSSNPLVLLSKRAGKRAVADSTFNWMEDASEPRFDAINNGGGYNTSATSLVVDNGAYFAEHYLVQNTRTGEVFRVTGVSTNTLTVVRGVGNSGTGVAMNDDDELLIIGIAQPEGDTSRPARSTNPSKVTNYTQIFREPWEATGTLLSSSNQVNPHDWNHQANKHGIEHAKDIEYTLWTSKSDLNTSGSQPRRTTKGVFNYITTNVTAAGGALTETTLRTFLRTSSRYTPGANRVLFASGLVVNAITGFAIGKLETHQSETTYGMNVQRYVSPFGSLDVVWHPLFEGTYYGGYAALLDMSEVKYCYLNGDGPGGSRDTHVRTNIQTNDLDGRKDEYLTECGLQLGNQKKHALLTGVTG